MHYFIQNRNGTEIRHKYLGHERFYLRGWCYHGNKCELVPLMCNRESHKLPQLVHLWVRDYIFQLHINIHVTWLWDLTVNWDGITKLIKTISIWMFKSSWVDIHDYFWNSVIKKVWQNISFWLRILIDWKYSFYSFIRCAKKVRYEGFYCATVFRVWTY